MQANMDRQMRIMMATQMAMTRERIPWMLAPYSLLVTHLAIEGLAKRPTNPVLKIPLLIGGLVIAYQVDFAYYNKADRMRDMFNDILYKEDHWFSKIEQELKAEE